MSYEVEERRMRASPHQRSVFRLRRITLLTGILFLGLGLISHPLRGDDASMPVAAPAQPPIPPAPQRVTPAPRLRALVNGLDQAALQEAFRLLSSDSIQAEQLNPLEVNRAALQGLLERLDFGAFLLATESKADRDSPFAFYRARIDSSLVYVRFGRYTEEEVGKFDSTLSEFQAETSTTHLILDLRSPQPQADFEIASALLSRFRPPNELLFKIRRPGSERSTLFISSPVSSGCRLQPVLLVDQDTGNVGEIIAAVLKRTTGCLIVGEQTPGLAVEYRDVPLGESRILRFATAEVVLEDNSSIFHRGITPDLITATVPKTKYEIFRSLDHGSSLHDQLFRKPRPRMNEAALVTRTDPEIDYHLLISQGKTTPWDLPPQEDRALQQTVDLLRMAKFLSLSPKPLK